MPAVILPALILLFFVSGACGLIYQVLWLRLLGLVFGVTVYSASTVWASFMAGLALGSYLGGRLGARSPVPLIWFGVVEVLVGLSALATPITLAALSHIYATWMPTLPESPVLVTALRAAMSFLVLIVPTVMMGASLPLIIRSSLFSGGELGARAGLLYGTNTLGAIAGTVAAGLYFIPALGITSTFQVAATLNVSAGLAAVLIGLAVRARRGVPQAAPVETAAGTAGVSGRARRLVLGVFFISGLATLALEVIWFRGIVLVARPTVYTFAILLATVLAGIAGGSYLVTPFMRRRANWVAVLAVIEILMAFAAITSLGMLSRVSKVNETIAPWLEGMAPGYLSYALAASVPVILPAALLMGMAYPIGLRLWSETDEGSDTGRVAARIGTFNSVNLIGAIAGSIAGGFVLLPWLGSRGSLIVVATLIALSGVVLLAAATTIRHRHVWAAVVFAVFGLIAARTPDPFQIFLAVRYPNVAVAYHEEAVEGTVSVHGSRPGEYVLVLDGNHQANDTPSMLETHRRIALLALALHPEAKDMLVVGLGGGATPGAASTHEGVEIDVVELSSAVVRASRFFSHVNNDLLSRPNVRMRIDDGRNYLALTSKKYDVITADLIQPVHAGSNNVYAREYFELVRRSLKPGGLAMQWANGTEAEYKAIARTFQTVFPNTTVWADGSLLLGTIEPLELRASDFNWKLALPGRRQGLEELGVSSFEDLLKLYKAGPDELRAFLGEGPILTDDRPLAEYFLSLPRGRNPDLTSLTGDVRRHVR